MGERAKAGALVTVEWNGDAYASVLRDAVATGLNASALAAEQIARPSMQNTTRIQGVSAFRKGLPSRPGQYPAVQTSALRNSLTTAMATPQNLRSAFGVFGGRRGVASFSGRGRTGYAAYLEFGTRTMRPRPWANRTVTRNKTRLENAFVRAAKRKLSQATGAAR